MKIICLISPHCAGELSIMFSEFYRKRFARIININIIILYRPLSHPPFFQGQVTSEQQFSFLPRQPQAQPQPQPQPQAPTRFSPTNGGFVSPSARPQVVSQDNVPTVPAVTNFERFRPSEATELEPANLRFQPSPRPAFEQPQPPVSVFQQEPAVNPPASFPNSHSNTLRTPTFTVPPALSIEPISSQGVISRPNLVAQESETTGTAFRGRQRVRVRPDQVDTGGRQRVRTKVRFGEQEAEQVEVETEAPVRGGRTRSRFTGTRTRTPTAPRVVATGQRKRQRQRDQELPNTDLPEEDRRSVVGSPRRKVNRVPSFTSRRKTTPPPEAPATRLPPRRRVKPVSFSGQETELETENPATVFETPSTKSSEALLRELLGSRPDPARQEDEGIAVLPASTVRHVPGLLSKH